SSPTIRIKLTQEKVIENKPEVKSATSTAAAPKVSRKKSITCVKRKVKRVVTGISPKCPSGFKKSI
ncbi:MAG: hypothetical protein ACO3FB_05480, partial [Candidatus Nanopelagicaceae bacterium]